MLRRWPRKCVLSKVKILTNNFGSEMRSEVFCVECQGSRPGAWPWVKMMIVSGFVVSLSYSVPGTWVGPVMKSIVVRIDVVVDALAEVRTICVVSGIGVDVLSGADANVLSVMATALEFIAVSALLE